MTEQLTIDNFNEMKIKRGKTELQKMKQKREK